MCRMAVIFDTQAPFEGKAEELTTFLAFLEHQQGGHGNGLGTFDAEGKPQIRKAVKFSPAECTAHILANPSPPRGWYFHTRLASMGGINDELCHPFTQGKYLFMHNGCWGEVIKVANWLLRTKQMDFKELKHLSDSFLMSWLIERFGYDAFHKFGMDGKIVVGTKDRTFLWISYGDFEALRFGKSWIYASEFPLGMERRADEHIAFEGMIVIEVTGDGWKQIGEGGKIRTIPPPSVEAFEFDGRAWDPRQWDEFCGGE